MKGLVLLIGFAKAVELAAGDRCWGGVQILDVGREEGERKGALKIILLLRERRSGEEC